MKNVYSDQKVIQEYQKMEGWYEKYERVIVSVNSKKFCVEKEEMKKEDEEKKDIDDKGK